MRSPQVMKVLDRLYADAELDDSRRPSVPENATAQQRADAMAEVYLPISPQGGDLLYALVRNGKPETVVEFGTSFGVSTLFLAAAVTDNGTGHVYGTEMSAAKIAAARSNVDEAGVGEVVTILEGDATQTLAELPGPIGFVLLDGWKDLYVPVLRGLEPRLAPGALVVADNTSFATVAGYLDYVREPANGYVNASFPTGDGMEISCWTGRS
ncbi:class I SAM-dependent methyltransferase [Lentzea sp. NBRC 105346]|uniref:O-methyltransferase n=1 Tax=Lentzea sp. NBRC 105346 TaxID=3032205 RepID=UPI0025578604|nr:class I SAM-dependent methyltransferase [Lentzea sp. NBRC 105346]